MSMGPFDLSSVALFGCLSWKLIAYILGTLRHKHDLATDDSILVSRIRIIGMTSGLSSCSTSNRLYLACLPKQIRLDQERFTVVLMGRMGT